MANTALRAEKAKEIIFISDAHEKFYYEKLKEVRNQDVYHKALVYCLCINDDTRMNIPPGSKDKQRSGGGGIASRNGLKRILHTAD